MPVRAYRPVYSRHNSRKILSTGNPAPDLENWQTIRSYSRPILLLSIANFRLSFRERFLNLESFPSLSMKYLWSNPAISGTCLRLSRRRFLGVGGMVISLWPKIGTLLHWEIATLLQYVQHRRWFRLAGFPGSWEMVRLLQRRAITPHARTLSRKAWDA